MSFTANNSQEQKFLYAPMAQPELGNLIKEARKAKKLSQRQLGEQLFVSYQTIANWENGLRAPIEANLIRLAMALDKPDNFFFNRVPEQEAEPVISTLSENLRTYRRRYGVSQIQLSEQTGVSLVKIKAYEDGNSGQFITNANLKKLCDFFEIDYENRDDLLGKSVTAEDMEDMTRGNYLREIEEATKRLNLIGLQKAAERITELTELRRYRK